MSCSLLQIMPIPEAVPHNDPLTLLSELDPLRWQVVRKRKLLKRHPVSLHSLVLSSTSSYGKGIRPVGNYPKESWIVRRTMVIDAVGIQHEAS